MALIDIDQIDNRGVPLRLLLSFIASLTLLETDSELCDYIEEALRQAGILDAFTERKVSALVKADQRWILELRAALFALKVDTLDSCDTDDRGFCRDEDD